MDEGVRLEQACAGDAGAMLEVHRAAIRGTASAVYDPEIIESWAPLPLQAEHIEGLAQRIGSGEEVAIVARDRRGTIIGFGSIVPSSQELRAVYVAPEHGRFGIGGMILRALEADARERGLTELGMDASINAEAFYRRHGFQVECRGEHVLGSGRRMACVRMRKRLLQEPG